MRVVRLITAWVPVLDLGIGLFATVLMQLDVWVFGAVAGARSAMSVLLLFATVPLVVRRRWPLAVTATVMTALSAQAVATGDASEGIGGILPFLVPLYTVGAYAGLRRALAGAAIVTAAGVVHGLEDTTISSAGQQWADAFAWSVSVVVWIVGVYVRRHREAADLRRAAVRAGEQTQAALAIERTRIARELHDVVSHTLSVMVVQADAGEVYAESAPERSRESFRLIQTTGRQALDEMRRLLGLLRADGPAPELAPQPGLADLDGLIAQVRAAGLDVTVEVQGEAQPLPAGLDLAAFRIVQEALTNALKYAPGARTVVRIGYRPRELAIEVADDGGAGATAADGTGHGLLGIGERVHLYGGEIEAGPRVGGGFRVRASLPVPAT